MKISYISDPHLDFWVPFTPSQEKWEKQTRELISKLIETDKGEKEVLCLAGDYSHYNQQTLWMLETFSEHYEQVFFTFGNHDFYLVSKNQQNKYRNNSLNRIDEINNAVLSKLENVIPLYSGRVFFYKGVNFGGDTMWYPLKTVEQKMFFNNVSNDSRLIKGVNMELEHVNSIGNYQHMIDRGMDVMVSHVPLCHLKSHEKYGSTSCYYTPVDQLPPYVIQGHSHERAVYKKAGSLLYMNCGGYPQDGLGEMGIRSFEIK